MNQGDRTTVGLAQYGRRQLKPIDRNSNQQQRIGRAKAKLRPTRATGILIRTAPSPIRWAQLTFMLTDRTISFSELRQTTSRIIDLVSEVTHNDKSKISLKTSINNDLGIDGDDWDEFLAALYNNENLVLDGFNFYDYFHDEAQIAWGPLNIIFLPVYFLIYVVTCRWKHESFRNFFSTDDSPKEPLTVADLVTSKIEGRFVKRVDRKFKVTS